MRDAEATDVVTVFLRNGGAVLLLRRSDEVGSYRGRWGAVAGHAEGGPDGRFLCAVGVQSPMASSWTVDRMPDCTDTTVLVTGANSGLGFEATNAFAANGATVIMACRSTDRGQQAAAEIRDSVGDTGATLNVRQCDLASLDSIESFASGVEQDRKSVV